MNLQHPEALYFILPALLVMLALALYARAMRRRAAAAFADSAMGARILPRESSARFWLKLAAWEAAVVFALLALARPQWGDVVEEVKVKGSDLYVLIDVSRSMLAKDVTPSRLERAKLDVSSLLNRLKGERVGLIAFAGGAVVKCPLTADYAFFRIALNELGPQSVDRGGTAIGYAIRVALNVLPVSADRDEALLLITDGDDQDSDPMHAAAEAAERHVTIFTVGLGDPNEGAKIPDKDGQNVRYEGKDVVSKMDDELLRKIALETNGAYVPARTSAYDLGKLYEEKLSLLRGEFAKEQKRHRMSERFEIPLVLSILCFLLELLIRPYEIVREAKKVPAKKAPVRPSTALLLLIGLSLSSASALGADGGALAREGLKLYEQKQYAAAGEKWNEAEKSMDREQRDEAARAAFDAGCAFQRGGDADKAREAYMKAALAPGKPLAAKAQYNLGTLAAEEAKKLAGDASENVAPEKRAEVLEKLKVAVGHFRNALDLQPEYPGARSDIELIRQWIKLNVNKWAELDRKKHRDSLQLLEYLDELAKTQRGLRAAGQALDENASADELAELRRAQDELLEEIEPLKEKIQKELSAAPPPGATTGQPAPDPKAIEGAIKKLQEWADEAGAKMRAAGDKFNAGDLSEGLKAQKDAVAPLERSWEALAPFGLTLQRDYDEQSKLVETLDPNAIEAEPKADSKEPAQKKEQIALSKPQLEELAELQRDVQRRTEQLKFKAEKELSTLEKNAPPGAAGTPPPKEKKEKEWLTLEDVQREEEAKKKAQAAPPVAPKDEKPDAKKPDEKDAPPDPEAVKKGYEKAIELAPKAAEKMQTAAGHLDKHEREAAVPDAVEARRILKEILDAQPKQKNKDQKQDDKKDQNKDQKDQDKNKQDQDKKDQQNKDKQDQKKQDDEKKKEEEQKKDQAKKDQDKKDQKKDQPKPGEKGQGQEKQQMSQEQANEMLRKVQEREQQRRKLKADEKEALYGRLRGVEKDW